MILMQDRNAPRLGAFSTFAASGAFGGWKSIILGGRCFTAGINGQTYQGLLEVDMKGTPGGGIGGDSAEVAALLSKYAGLLKQYGDDTVVYECDSIDLLVLHGVVCLGADHPGFQDLSNTSKLAVERFRGFCKRVWMRQGFSPDEADRLDRLRAEVGRS